MGGLVPDGLLLVQGLLQETDLFADAGFEDLGASPADGVIPLDPGDFLRRAVEAGDPKFQIHGKDPVRYGVEDGIQDTALRDYHLGRPFL
jgi:hypothetical protein